MIITTLDKTKKIKCLPKSLKIFNNTSILEVCYTRKTKIPQEIITNPEEIKIFSKFTPNCFQGVVTSFNTSKCEIRIELQLLLNPEKIQKIFQNEYTYWILSGNKRIFTLSEIEITTNNQIFL